jgi:hypothetical protein
MAGISDFGALRKHRLLWILLLSKIALAAVCSVVGPLSAWAQQPPAAARIVVNDVTGTLPAARERAVVHVGDKLVQNEVIDTATGSATLIDFQDNSELAVCPSAEIVLNRAEIGTSPASSGLVVFIANGCTRFSSGLLLKTVLFTTPSCEIRTSGTILTVTVSARGGTTVSVAEGTASVTGAGQTVIVRAGQSTLVLRGSPPTPPVPTPPQPPIVIEMDRLLRTASARDFGTRAAARSPAVEAPTDVGTNTFTPNVDGKIQSEIAGDATPAFGPCAGTSGTLGSNGTHDGCVGPAGSRGTHGSAGSRGTH